MAVLQSTNVQGTLCVNGVAVGGSKDFKFCCFTASDTFTPSQDLVDGNGVIHAHVVGGGGGGGSIVGLACGYIRFLKLNCNRLDLSGGGAGAFIDAPLEPITATDACTVTVGQGGNAGGGSFTFTFNEASFPEFGASCLFSDFFELTASEAGGNSQFGNILIASGGQGGVTAGGWCGWTANCCCCCVEGPVGAHDGCRASGYYNEACNVANRSANCYDTFGISPGTTPDKSLSVLSFQEGVDSTIQVGKVGVSGVTCGNAARGYGYGSGNSCKTFNIGANGGSTCCYCRGFTPTASFGYGNAGAGFGLCGCTHDNARAAFQLTGSNGTDGIVVLQWNE